MEWLEAREIEYLVTLAELLSVSRAAENCFVSQPQFSKLIRRAEKRIGVELFDRSTHPLTLRPEGEILLPQLKKLQEANREFLRSCAALRKNREADLTIAAPSFFCTHSLPPLIKAFGLTEPNYHIRLIESNDQDLKALLESGSADLGITVQTDLTGSFSAELLGQETVILAVPAPFSVNRELEAKVLSVDMLKKDFLSDPAIPSAPLSLFKNTDFLFLKSGNDLRERAMALCLEAGFSPRITMELDQLLTAYYLAEAGLGATFTRASTPLFTGGEGKLCFYKIDHSLACRNVWLLYGGREKLPPAGRSFVRFMKQELLL